MPKIFSLLTNSELDFTDEEYARITAPQKKPAKAAAALREFASLLQSGLIQDAEAAERRAQDAEAATAEMRKRLAEMEAAPQAVAPIAATEPRKELKIRLENDDSGRLRHLHLSNGYRATVLRNEVGEPRSISLRSAK